MEEIVKTEPKPDHPIVDLLKASIPLAESLLKGGVPVLAVIEVLMQILHSHRAKATADEAGGPPTPPGEL